MLDRSVRFKGGGKEACGSKTRMLKSEWEDGKSIPKRKIKDRAGTGKKDKPEGSTEGMKALYGLQSRRETTKA